MWHPGTLGSYERARTSEEQSDDQTLADDTEFGLTSGRDDAKSPTTDLPYFSDELALNDPLDEGNALNNDAPSSPRWANGWRLRPNPPPPLDLTEKKNEDTVGLINDEANVALVTGAAISPRLARTGRRTVSWLVWPLPSWTHWLFGVRYPEEPRRQTDYLDGLRGVASLFVFFEHYILKVHDRYVHQSYAYEDNWNVLQLPFIRTIYSGPAMVAIFFIISGYVLSQRCVVAMRAHQPDKVHSALTSMTFRRAIRLFLPSIVISFMALAMVLLGLLAPQFPEEWTWGTELDNFHYHMFHDLFKLWDWGINYEHWYAPQLWTIPVEYRCSLILFVFILMVARTTVFMRFLIEIFTIGYLFYVERWDVALFLVGMFIAELNVISEERKKRKAEAYAIGEDPEKDVESQRSGHKRWFNFQKSHIPLWIMLVVGVYLTGYPDQEAEYTPGYDFLADLWEEDWDYKFRFWLSQAAIMIVLSVSFLPNAQALFTTSIARYLGKISYALYLVHALMNMTIRVVIWDMFWKVLRYKEEDGREGLKFEGGWILGTLLYFPLVFWAADLFWRAVDIPTVKFAKWLEGRCFVKN